MRMLSIVSGLLLTTLILGCDCAPTTPDYAGETESTVAITFFVDPWARSASMLNVADLDAAR